ncbi:sulfatase-like hydrolase/transferase, partial [Erwinia amylovora]
RAAADVDQQIHNVLNTLEQKGLLANTVVVITAQHGVVLDDNSHDGNRAMLQVPLVVHWPATPAQTVNKLTVHQDIMTTLMQRLLQVNTPASDYSQGEDLFAAQRRHNWVTGRNADQLLISTPEETLALDSNGNYSAWDLQGKRLKDRKPQLALLLQVLTDEKRFIAN